MTIPLHYVATDAASGRILRGDDAVADIRDLVLCDVRFHAGGEPVVGSAGIPLYWRQYHNHEDPERSAHAEGRIETGAARDGELLLRCTGTNASGAARSECVLLVTADADGAIEYVLRLVLTIANGREWRITPHPQHGELEFLNLWPAGVFPQSREQPKRYDGCFVLRGDSVERIAHHHLESSDKHDIRLEAGDVFCYLLETENPAVQILEGEGISAGLCAYMWDAHFALRVYEEGEDVLLNDGDHFSAAVRLFSIDAERGRELAALAIDAPCPELADTPFVVRGLNTFVDTGVCLMDESAPLWPWSFEGGRPDAGGTLDRNVGYSDSASLRIAHGAAARSRWVASTLGPAFGEDPFPQRAAYRLGAWVRSADAAGALRIALRLHREGREGLFDPSTYEMYASETLKHSDAEWTRLVVTTPVIEPAPDRLHLLLEFEGEGVCHFDDVLFEELPSA